MKVCFNGKVPIKMFVDHVDVEDQAMEQLINCSRLPFIHKHVAVMPDVHLGYGATVGSVIPTKGAVVPSAVGVDIGCGMVAQRLDITSAALPDSMALVRSEIERVVPHGRTANGKAGVDRGGWGTVPEYTVGLRWRNELAPTWEQLIINYPLIKKGNLVNHLGTLGTGNHFIELCLDEEDRVWVMLHSGSRGVGNRIGTYFINLAKLECERWHVTLPDRDLAYLPEGTLHFDGYMKAVGWAQDFARINRELMLAAVMGVLIREFGCGPAPEQAINCHHNYVQRENHFGANVLVTRKGAVRAREGDLGIIPGSMGERSFIVRGKGNADSFNSCSHGAGRRMSRTQARKQFTADDLAAQTEGVECRKDEGVVDEIPSAYKNIDDVMASQTDLVDVVHTLKQFVCVKG